MSIVPSLAYSSLPQSRGVGVEHTSIISNATVAYSHFLLPLSREYNTLRRRFYALAAQWKDETAFLSSTSEIVRHPAYQEIIQLGNDVVPYILADLKISPNHWFHALRTITSENPVEPTLQGRMQEMSDAWIDWGRQRGMIA